MTQRDTTSGKLNPFKRPLGLPVPGGWPAQMAGQSTHCAPPVDFGGAEHLQPLWFLWHCKHRVLSNPTQLPFLRLEAGRRSQSTSRNKIWEEAGTQRLKAKRRLGKCPSWRPKQAKYSVGVGMCVLHQVWGDKASDPSCLNKVSFRHLVNRPATPENPPAWAVSGTASQRSPKPHGLDWKAAQGAKRTSFQAKRSWSWIQKFPPTVLRDSKNRWPWNQSDSS